MSFGQRNYIVMHTQMLRLTCVNDSVDCFVTSDRMCSWYLTCLVFIRYSGRTQKELAEYVRDNYVTPTQFER